MLHHKELTVTSSIFFCGSRLVALIQRGFEAGSRTNLCWSIPVLVPKDARFGLGS